jgi:hypothetical protein
MAQQSNSKRHHYVSQWHLKRFTEDPARPRPRLACYSKSRDAYFVAPVRNLAAIGHYHTWEHDGCQDRIVEEGMSILDARASEVFPKLERMESLVETEPNVIATYVALQQGRVPAGREVFQELIESIGQSYAEAVFAEPSEKRLAEARRRGLANTEDELRALDAHILGQIRRGEMKVTMDHIATAGVAAIAAEMVAPIIEAMSWLVVEAPPGAEFLVSDNPVVMFSERTPPGVPVGYMTLDVEVCMPLSRNHMLIVSHIDTCSGWACATADAVLDLNRRTWLTAKEFVYGSTERILRATGDDLPLDVRRRQLAGLRTVSVSSVAAGRTSPL